MTVDPKSSMYRPNATISTVRVRTGPESDGDVRVWVTEHHVGLPGVGTVACCQTRVGAAMIQRSYHDPSTTLASHAAVREAVGKLPGERR